MLMGICSSGPDARHRVRELFRGVQIVLATVGGLWTCLLKEFSDILRQVHMREDSWVVRKVDLGRFVGLQRRSARGSSSHEVATEETDHLIQLRLRLEMLGG